MSKCLPACNLAESTVFNFHSSTERFLSSRCPCYITSVLQVSAISQLFWCSESEKARLVSVCIRFLSFPPFLSSLSHISWSMEACGESKCAAVRSPVSVCLIHRRCERFISRRVCIFARERKGGGGEQKISINGGQHSRGSDGVHFEAGQGASVWKWWKLMENIQAEQASDLFLFSSPTVPFHRALEGHWWGPTQRSAQ